jgi:hypothetical protein
MKTSNQQADLAAKEAIINHKQAEAGLNLTRVKPVSP